MIRKPSLPTLINYFVCIPPFLRIIVNERLSSRCAFGWFMAIRLLASLIESAQRNSTARMNQLSDAHSSSYILHPNIHQANPKVISARGNYITLESGQRILDATGGPAVACIGHGNVQVREAVTTQMDQFSFCHGLSYSNSAAEDLAREVIDTTNGAMARVTIMCSGEPRTSNLQNGFLLTDVQAPMP